MNVMIRPDDRTPEERLRDAIDEAEAEAYAEQAARLAMMARWRYRLWEALTPMRASLLAITALWAFTIAHIADTYSPHVAWLCALCTGWGIAAGFLLTFEWYERRDQG